MANRFDNKVVVVTGAASGLGLATARALASKGATLALIDNNAVGVAAAAESIGGDAIGIVADISNTDEIRTAIQQVSIQFGAIDIVMAGAAITGWGPALLIDPAQWERAVEINVLGTWRTVHATLPYLVKSKGYLLIVSSGFAAAPGPALSAYALSKAAVESLARSLRIEVAHHGVDVGVAYYTFLDTPMVQTMEGNPAAMRGRAAMPAPIRRTYPLGNAVAATVHGIERREQRIMYPKFLRWTLLLRGAFGPRSERASRKAMPDVERLAQEQHFNPGVGSAA